MLIAHAKAEATEPADLTLLREIETALRSPPASPNGDGFTLYAQPIQSLHPEGLPALEILLRWRVGRDLRLPGAFLPFAHRHNLMPEIDRWVVRQVFAVLSRHASDLHRKNYVAVNLSAVTLSSPRLLHDIRSEVLRSGMDARKLCFEVIETEAITDLAAARLNLIGMRDMGFHVALDDFGVGHSNYALLRALPFDQIKIDGLFVRELPHNAQDAAMVSSICAVARQRGLAIVAEFVSNDPAILDLLRECGVDAVQSFAFGRPEPLVDALSR